jgi:hypothetical protein
MPRGGKREGAGRKPKREKYSGPINKAEKRIADRLPELLDNMFALAAGVTVQDVGADGTTDVYTRPPDRDANKYLIDRILGRPTERHEADVDVTSAGKQLGQVVFYLPDNGRDSTDTAAGGPAGNVPRDPG